ncbi:MAG TPA: hypothetical protein DHW63_08575 [Hyphomonadaceae bacterium]|nr:hypothetical protein [Hyphomonadaceae bacterium]
MINLLGLDSTGMEQFFAGIGEKPFRARQVLKWIHRRGAADFDAMTDIAKDLGKDEMQTIAKFFSEQAWPRTGYTSDPALALKGQVATDSGECVQCHLGTFTGNSRIPRLAGQHKDYLQKTMLDLKSKARNNAAAIATLMASYSDEDIAAMADYLAGM